MLVAAELAVPLWAEQPAMTNWHPHHIAERYGLFTIIVLGECVLAAFTAVRAMIDEDGLSIELVLVAGGSLGLLFALWWVYFLKDAGGGLERNRHLGFWWGYGHYVVFGSLAALGAGLELAAEAVTHHIEASDTVVATAMRGAGGRLPARGLGAARADGCGAGAQRRPRSSPQSLACLLVVLLVAAGLPLGWAVLLLVVPPAALIVHHHTTAPDVRPQSRAEA